MDHQPPSATEKANQETNPKSPKSPKLNEEEFSEMKISEAKPKVEEDQEEENIVDKEFEDNEDIKGIEGDEDIKGVETVQFIQDSKVIQVLKDLIGKAPAGQVKTVSDLCGELFEGYKEVIEEECKKKLAKDAHFDGEKLITEDEDNPSGNVTCDEDEGFLKELKEKIEGYVKELYPGCGSFKIVPTTKNGYKVHILAQKSKAQAFWSGHWHSSWTISSTGEGYVVDGEIDLVVHYHEEGSVQLSTKKVIPSRAPLSNAEKVSWRIKDCEDALQVSLNEAYQQLADNIFKKLRRQMPVTRTKMDWEKFSNYNLSNELKE